MTVGREALAQVATDAPDAPGVYFFLDDAGEVLYVGTAGRLRRRLAQHARAPATSHLHARYDLVRSVRWAATATDQAAAWREADLIWALRPPFNAESTPRSPGSRPRPAPFLVVGAGPAATTFELRTDHPDAGRVHGCFPHLGKGQGSRRGVTTSDGYVALLRLLWAASPAAGPMPAVITRAAPDRFDVAVDADLTPALHRFLSGTGARLLDHLAVRIERRPPEQCPALRRDLHAARGFYAAGPAALRATRLAAGRAPGPIDPEDLRGLLAAEVADLLE